MGGIKSKMGGVGGIRFENVVGGHMVRKGIGGKRIKKMWGRRARWEDNVAGANLREN